MGLFERFGRDSRIKNEERGSDSFGSQSTAPAFENGQRSGPIVVFSPKSYQDVQTIIDTLKNNKTAVVHLTELKAETARRVLDMLSGAIYALNGGVYEMQQNVFMFSPSGVEMN